VTRDSLLLALLLERLPFAAIPGGRLCWKIKVRSERVAVSFPLKSLMQTVLARTLFRTGEPCSRTSLTGRHPPEAGTQRKGLFSMSDRARAALPAEEQRHLLATRHVSTVSPLRQRLGLSPVVSRAHGEISCFTRPPDIRAQIFPGIPPLKRIRAFVEHDSSGV